MDFRRFLDFLAFFDFFDFFAFFDFFDFLPPIECDVYNDEFPDNVFEYGNDITPVSIIYIYIL